MHYNAGDFDLFTYLNNPQVLDVNEGSIALLTGPGLGIEMNEELIRKNSKENSDFSWRNPTCEWSPRCRKYPGADSPLGNRAWSGWRYQRVVAWISSDILVLYPVNQWLLDQRSAQTYCYHIL
jgi:hypothetical protein